MIGPEEEGAWLVACLNTAREFGAVEAIRRLQKRLIAMEKERLEPAAFEFYMKTLPIYSFDPAKEHPNG